jgi:hypothetical protein
MISTLHSLKEYHLQPKIGAHYRFRFETIIDDFTNKKSPVQKAYIREVEIMPIGKQGNIEAYQVFTGEISIKSNVSIADEYLIKQIGYAFDELEIGVDFTGKMIRVFNTEALRFRWNKKRFELEEEYGGNYIQSYFRHIDSVLGNESSLIEFLSGYKMFGLYFHGLFGSYLPLEMPIKREMIIEDFENIIVEESIFPEKREAVKYRIEGVSAALEKYRGELIYQDFQLQEAWIECSDETQSISYGALFLG